MLNRLKKMMALVLLIAMLATLPGVAACGNGEETSGKKLIFGWDWDFTGRSALGVTQLYTGLVDYLRMTKETNPVPGTEVELKTYDTKSDAARVVVGYRWLKDRGMDLFSCSPTDFPMLRSQLEADNTPSFLGSTLLEILDSPLVVSVYGPPDSQLEVIMDWIMDNWDVSANGKCKIGFVGFAGLPFFESQRDTVMEIINENPDKLEITSVQMVPSTTTTWATEIGKLKDSDYIGVAMTGPPLTSFIMESRQRGYEKGIVGPLECMMAFWSLVKAAVPPAGLEGCVSGFYFPWYTDTGAFMTEVKAAMQEYRADEAAELLEGTGYLCGWAYGMILVDSLRRAADEVGGENVTGMDLFRAVQETDMAVEGFGGFDWKTTPTANALMRAVALYEYKANVEDWVMIEDFVIPPSLGG